MELNLNSQHLKHIKSGESVFDALRRLGGRASSKELVKQIATSLNEPEEAVQSDVKHVLRAAVVNGYIVRHGKNYLLSRSCRLLCTDGKCHSNKTSSKKKETMGSSSTFPTWWNRFWYRFVAFKKSDDSSSAEEQLSSNDMHLDNSCLTELNKLNTGTSMNLIPSDKTDTERMNESTGNEVEPEISKPESSVPIIERENNISLKSIISEPPPKESERNNSFQSISSSESKPFLANDMPNPNDYPVD